ncbi:MAG: hypothetical protein JXB06_03640 [Spirochaetales bacterium]|nr:hypothetical protein [Spirochaetales bacterium]
MDRDGEAGTIEDVYFDHLRWVLRYLLLRHRTIGRDILISPLIIDEIRWPERRIRLRLFDEEIDAAPAIDTDRSITREQEKSYNEYFFVPDYWEGEDLWGEETTPGELRSWLRAEQHKARGNGESESYLLNASTLAKFTLQSPQGIPGTVSDFLWSPETYAVRFLVIHIGGLLSSKKTLLSPLWITALDRSAATIRVELPKEAIEEAPPYEVGEPITPAYEKNIMSHYNALEYKTRASSRRRGG